MTTSYAEPFMGVRGTAGDYLRRRVKEIESLGGESGRGLLASQRFLRNMRDISETNPDLACVYAMACEQTKAAHLEPIMLNPHITKIARERSNALLVLFEEVSGNFGRRECDDDEVLYLAESLGFKDI